MNNISSFLIYGSNLNKMYITASGLCKVDCGDGTILNFNYIPTKNKHYECYDIKHCYKHIGYYLIKIIGKHVTFHAPETTIKAFKLSNTIIDSDLLFGYCAELQHISHNLKIKKSTSAFFASTFYHCIKLSKNI